MTPKMPAYSWRNYDAYNDQYKLYAICGPGVSGVSVNFNNLDRSCTSATIKCGSDLQCVQQQVTYDQQSGARLVFFNISFLSKNILGHFAGEISTFSLIPILAPLDGMDITVLRSVLILLTAPFIVHKTNKFLKK